MKMRMMSWWLFYLCLSLLTINQFAVSFQILSSSINKSIRKQNQFQVKHENRKNLFFDKVVAQEVETPSVPSPPEKKSKFTHLQYAAFPILIGGLSSVIISRCKLGVSMIDQRALQQYASTPLIAGIFLSILQFISPLSSKSLFVDIDNDISAKHLLLRLLSVVASVGGGLSLGFASPASEIGVAVANRIASPLRASKFPVYKVLLIAGAAAGFAFNFNTPISGLLFALEIVRSQMRSSNPENSSDAANSPEIRMRNMLFHLISITTALYIFRGPQFFSNTATAIKFPFESFSFLPPASLFFFISFLLTGIFSGGLFQIIQETKTAFQLAYTLLRIPEHIKPIIAGFLCTVSMLYSGVPQSVSAGFKMTNDVLMRKAEFAQVFPFVVWKLIAYACSSVSNVPGGVIAPLLFIGAGYGVFFKDFLSSQFPNLFINTFSSSLYPLLIGSSLLSLHFKSFIFPAIFLLEMTRSFDLMIPFMLTSLSAQMTSQVLSKVSDLVVKKRERK